MFGGQVVEYHSKMLAQRYLLLMAHELKACANTLASSTDVTDGDNVNGRSSFDQGDTAWISYFASMSVNIRKFG